MEYIAAATDILLTVEDTKAVLSYHLRELDKRQRRLLEKELKRPFDELKKEYIAPHLYPIVKVNGQYGTSPVPNYKDGIDNLYMGKESHLDYHGIATANWLERKELEIKNLFPTNKKASEPPFHTIKLDSVGIAERLWDFLYENRYLQKNTQKAIFLGIFSINEGDYIEHKPLIEWIKGIQLYNYFFHFLEVHGFIDIGKNNISSKLIHGEFFVNGLENNKPFERLQKRRKEFYKKRVSYSKMVKDPKLLAEIEKLDTFIKGLKSHKKPNMVDD